MIRPTDSEPSSVVFDPEPETEMLVDFCRKTLATARGDGHHEMVLGITGDGTYIIDVYDKPVGSENESHLCFRVTEQAWLDASDYIRENNLPSYEHKRGPSLCGGDFVIRFKKEDGTFCRLTSGNMPDRNVGRIEGISAILESHLQNGTRNILP